MKARLTAALTLAAALGGALAASSCATLPKDYKGHALVDYAEDARYFIQDTSDGFFLYVAAKYWDEDPEIGEDDEAFRRCDGLFLQIAEKRAKSKAREPVLPSRYDKQFHFREKVCTLSGFVTL